jgi:chromosome segregation ATPase
MKNSLSYEAYLKSPYKSIKHSTYFGVYDALFSRYRNKDVTFVEIEVLAETSPTSKENTKVSWTSAEQLADAIFPTNADNMQQSLEPFHHGLLNHKMEIEMLCKTNEKLSSMLEKQQRCTSHHQTLHSAHEAKHAALRSAIKETQDSAIASDTLSKNNADTLNKHDEWFETMKQQQKEQYAGLVNHRDTLRSLQESHTNLNSKTAKHEESIQTHSAKHREFHHGLLDHKNKIEELRNTTASMQRSISEIQNSLHQQQITPQRLENLNERTQSLERTPIFAAQPTVFRTQPTIL